MGRGDGPSKSYWVVLKEKEKRIKKGTKIKKMEYITELWKIYKKYKYIIETICLKAIIQTLPF